MSDIPPIDATLAPPAPESTAISAPRLRARPTRPADATASNRVLEVVYEDDNVLMEWSVRTPASATIAVTFDPILVDPSQPAYAGIFLQRMGIDTLCVRKKSEHFYQALTRERFEEATRPVLEHYGRRLAYGSSLGAYAVLYFCRHGYETVISSSPRVSAHPHFGRRHWQERVAFQHEFFDGTQPATSGAIVFYDPMDDMDRRFVDEGLRHGWPQARFVAVPYAGHPANQFLSEIGYIAAFVQATVSAKPPPLLDRRGTKARSFTYRHVLAAACLRHGKPGWAERLCRQALEMKPDFISVKLTLGQALMALGRPDEAVPALTEFQQKYPQDGDARMALQAIARERARRKRLQLLPIAAELVRRWRRKLRSALAQMSLRGGLATLWLTGSLHLTVSHADIVWCYRHLLGREAESDQAVLAHRRCARFELLVRAFVRSPEFVSKFSDPRAAPEFECLIRTAVLARRVLRPDGRMAVLSVDGRSSVAMAQRTGSHCADPAAPETTDQPDAAIGAHESGQEAASVDLCLNAEELVLETTDGGQAAAHLMNRINHLLRPDGHVLLKTQVRHASGAPDSADGAPLAERLLQAHRFQVLQTVTTCPDGRTQLTLARKPS
jgi:hypothetical protein